jgi:hypothetical protein
MKLKIAVAVIAAAVISTVAIADRAEAIPAPTISCADGTITIEKSCAGSFSGNNLGANSDLPSNLFGVSTWGDDITVNNGGTTSLNTVSLTITSGGSTGTWSATGLGNWKNAMLVLKAGNAFSAYHIDLNQFTDNIAYAWNTLGTNRNSQGKAQDLSHASLYVADARESGPSPIPLPAAAWLLLSGIGGLGAMGWRKRRRAA